MMRTTVAIALLLISAVARAAPVPVAIIPAAPNDLSPIAALVPFPCSMTATTVVSGFAVRATFTRDDLGCVEIGPPSNSAAHFGPLPPGTYAFEAYENGALYATTTFTVTSTAIPTLSEITRALLLLALSATGVWILAWRGGIRGTAAR